MGISVLTAMAAHMAEAFSLLWQGTVHAPLLWITVTLVVYQGAEWLFQRSGGHLLCNPVLTSIPLIIAVLAVSGTSYQTYIDGAQFINFLLGPAIVALAVPLYRQYETLRRRFGTIMVTMLAGSFVAAGSAVAIAWALRGSPEILLSLVAKSVTVPIAMGISEKVGGLPALTAVIVLMTGIVGNVTGAAVLNFCRVTDRTARGLAFGVAAHGNGTARAMREDAQSGAFSGLAMVLNGLISSLFLPALVLSLH